LGDLVLFVAEGFSLEALIEFMDVDVGFEV
jgi:hypothetical protein